MHVAMPTILHDNDPMLIPNLYSKTRLARLLDVDSRTVAGRIKKLNIRPAVELGAGRTLFDENALETLRANQRAMREIFAEGRTILYGPATSVKSVS